MSKLPCNICGSDLGKAIYQSPSNLSLTSLCQLYTETTSVYACHNCGHLQTTAMDHVTEYYDQDYDILVESDEEDQIYEMSNGVPIYRTGHQLNILQNKLSLPIGSKILDYGCAKSSTMRALLQERKDIRAYLFDVSSRYVPFWQKFTPSERWSTYAPKPEWREHFDIVTSFFSLEHMTEPVSSLKQISNLLKPGGIFYGVIPNVLTNVADFIVIDHVNHFTPTSLHHLIRKAGLQVQEIDVHSHRGAIVVVATRGNEQLPVHSNEDRKSLAITLAQLADIGNYWETASQRIRKYEQSFVSNEAIAIYGAGFYGSFTAASLLNPQHVVCFLDQNPYLQGKYLNKKPIIAPNELPPHIRKLLVGLNPVNARNIIADIPTLSKSALDFFYL